MAWFVSRLVRRRSHGTWASAHPGKYELAQARAPALSCASASGPQKVQRQRSGGRGGGAASSPMARVHARLCCHAELRVVLESQQPRRLAARGQQVLDDGGVVGRVSAGTVKVGAVHLLAQRAVVGVRHHATAGACRVCAGCVSGAWGANVCVGRGQVEWRPGGRCWTTLGAACMRSHRTPVSLPRSIQAARSCRALTRRPARPGPAPRGRPAWWRCRSRRRAPPAPRAPGPLPACPPPASRATAYHV